MYQAEVLEAGIGWLTSSLFDFVYLPFRSVTTILIQSTLRCYERCICRLVTSCHKLCTNKKKSFAISIRSRKQMCIHALSSVGINVVLIKSIVKYCVWLGRPDGKIRRHSPIKVRAPALIKFHQRVPSPAFISYSRE